MPTPKIEHYSFGRITVDGAEYRKDLIIHDSGVIPNWWRQEGHRLNTEDLDKVIALSPKVLVVGCGSPGSMVVPTSTVQWLEKQGIQAVVLPTSDACDYYNKMSTNGGVVAAFHLTC